MSQPQMEELVDLIAERVRSRLGLQTPSTVSGVGEPPCAGCRLPEDACAVCGVNPLTRPDPAMLRPIGTLSAKDMAKVIDHTLLKPEATRQQIETLCKEARQHGFFSVCVNSSMVHLARSFLHGSSVKVCAVVGFPLGAGTPGAKAYEAREAVRCGAAEIDMVMNIGALRSLDYALVEDDIRKVVKAVQPKLVKVILETGMLSQAEKVIACALAKSAGAHYVKTSTGFGPGGATVEDIALMREVVGPELGVKASGGVRDYAGAQAMLDAGASRIGCSSGVAIVTGGKGTSGY